MNKVVVWTLLTLDGVMQAPGFALLGSGADEPSLGRHSAVRVRATDPYRHMVGFESDDLDADYRLLSAAGVEFIESPTAYDGLRFATLTDPEGT